MFTSIISKNQLQKVLPKFSPNYLQYIIHKGWLLSWNHFIVIIHVSINLS